VTAKFVKFKINFLALRRIEIVRNDIVCKNQLPLYSSRLPSALGSAAPRRGSKISRKERVFENSRCVRVSESSGGGIAREIIADGIIARKLDHANRIDSHRTLPTRLRLDRRDFRGRENRNLGAGVPHVRR